MPQNLKGLKVLFLVAPRGFQDEELEKPRRILEAAGAELLVLATNTMHLVADRIAAAVDIPFLHIADAAAAALGQTGVVPTFPGLPEQTTG